MLNNVIYCPIIGCDHLQYQTYLAERPEKSLPYEKSRNSLISHTLKTSQAYNLFKCSPGSHSQPVGCSVGITNSCSLPDFPLSVILVSSYLHCLCSLASRHCNYARLLVATQVFKAAIKVKLHGNNVHEVA